MIAYLIAAIPWAALLIAILRDADAYDRAHPAKRPPAHGAGEMFAARNRH